MPDDTPIYNLKAVIHETGLSPATLRAWERRYGLLKPQRSPGGHRLYSEHEILMLKWLIARQEEGLSISQAVEMWRNLEENEQNPLRMAQTPPQAASPSGVVLDDLRREWIDSCMIFDEQAAERALAQAFAITAPEIVCTEVLQKGLAEIGERWYSGSASVQQEHFASALAMRRLNTLFAAAPSPTRTGRILAACPPGEQHDFILLMLAFLLRRRGWDVVYLGANVPIPRLDATIQRISPRLIISVAQTLISAASLRAMAEYANNQDVALAYGGGIFNHISGLHDCIPGFFLGSDVAAVPTIVEHLLSQLPARTVARPVSTEYTNMLQTFALKEPFIMASVTAALQPAQLEPAHLEGANTNFSRYLLSALTLGDINFLDHSFGWLEGLLENHGLSPTLASRYYTAYRQAVGLHLGDQAVLILDWLAKFETEVAHA